MFTGEYCEEKVDASGSFSFLMFLFMVALVAAGIGLLVMRDRMQKEMKTYQASGSEQYSSSQRPQRGAFGNLDDASGQPPRGASGQSR